MQKIFHLAIKIYDHLLKFDRKNFHTNVNKLNLLAELGFTKNHCTTKALHTVPDNQSVLFNLVTTLYDLGRYDEAIQIFDKVIRIQPKNIDATCNKANTLVALDKHTQAI